MKKFLLIMLAMFVFGLQNISAQDAIKIVSGHPDFNIKVKRCAASGKNVVVDLVLTNTSENDIDLDITVFRSVIHDDEGNEYKNIGTKVNITLKIGNKEPSGHKQEFTLISGIPTKAQWVIKGVPESCEAISRIQFPVRCDAWSLEGSKATIRNIPISRQ